MGAPVSIVYLERQPANSRGTHRGGSSRATVFWSKGEREEENICSVVASFDDTGSRVSRILENTSFTIASCAAVQHGESVLTISVVSGPLLLCSCASLLTALPMNWTSRRRYCVAEYVAVAPYESAAIRRINQQEVYCSVSRNPSLRRFKRLLCRLQPVSTQRLCAALR